MIIVDNALKAREEQGKPIRVGMVGAGFMGQGLTNQITHSVPGMRMAAVYNRRPERAKHVFPYSGLDNIVMAGSQAQLDQAIRQGQPAVAEDPFMMCRSSEIDVIVDVTGSVEFGAHVILEAFEHGKPVVLMNAEVDATMGPILQVYASQHKVILSACERHAAPLPKPLQDGRRAALSVLGSLPSRAFRGSERHRASGALRGQRRTAPRGPMVEVCAVAKRDLTAGEVLDEYGMYTTYGEAVNTEEMSTMRYLPEGLVEGCKMKHAVAKDKVLTYDAVELPAGRLADRLRAEQYRHFGNATWIEEHLQRTQGAAGNLKAAFA